MDYSHDSDCTTVNKKQKRLMAIRHSFKTSNKPKKMLKLREETTDDKLEWLSRIAQEQDRIYLYQLDLARAFEKAATDYAMANPDAMIICCRYIGPESQLIHDARSSVAQTVSVIRRTLDKAQRSNATASKDHIKPIDFGEVCPVQTFLANETCRREILRQSYR